jgi:Ni,Fe-hydrogenase I large subunit
VKTLVDGVLAKLGAGPEVLFSTLGRVAARGIETKLLADKMGDWVDELAANMGRGELRIHDTDKWDPSSWPSHGIGAGFHEAPRGALGHWVHVKNGKIAQYQCIVPSTWNAGPRDARGNPGPYEAAIVGTPVADPEQPIEILRTVHSFDPCMACGVHVVDPLGRELARVKVR